MINVMASNRLKSFGSLPVVASSSGMLKRKRLLTRIVVPEELN
jgi:hypothetical protein